MFYKEDTPLNGWETRKREVGKNMERVLSPKCTIYGEGRIVPQSLSPVEIAVPSVVDPALENGSDLNTSSPIAPLPLPPLLPPPPPPSPDYIEGKKYITL